MYCAIGVASAESARASRSFQWRCPVAVRKFSETQVPRRSTALAENCRAKAFRSVLSYRAPEPSARIADVPLSASQRLPGLRRRDGPIRALHAAKFALPLQIVP